MKKAGNKKPRGRFITFEGIDGAGKSTHIEFVTRLLEEAGKEVIVTREPGGTHLGEKLRKLLLHDKMEPETEALLMFAARQEHIKLIIEPALERGIWVVSDRFSDASFAYQGGGRGLSLDKLRMLEYWVHPHLQPDLTLLFDLDAKTAAGRVQNRVDKSRAQSPSPGTRKNAGKKEEGGEADKFENEQIEFFEQVRNAYLNRASEFLLRFRVIDTRETIPQIQVRLRETIQELIEQNEIISNRDISDK